MDPISHALLGGCTAQSVIRRALDHKRVIAFGGICGALAAMMPDLDVFIRSQSDPLLGITFHRHFTHSIAFIPIGGLIAAFLIWLLYRGKFSFREIYFFSVSGYATHCFLDAMTTYGTHLFLPFSQQRISVNVLPIVDPIVTLTLLVGFFASLITRRQIFARTALVAFCLYVAFGFLQNHRAEMVMREIAANKGESIERYQVMPTIGNLMLWRAIYESGGTLNINGIYVSPLARTEIYEGGKINTAYPTPKNFPELKVESQNFKDIKRFDFFANHYIARKTTEGNVIGDMRFSMMPDGVEPLWGIRINPERQDGHIVFENFRQSPTSADWSRFFKMLRGEKL